MSADNPTPQERTYTVVEKEKSKWLDNLPSVVLGIFSMVLMAQGALSVQQIKEMGIMQYQLAEIKGMQSTFITRAEADQRAKARDIQMGNVETRLGTLERKVLN